MNRIHGASARTLWSLIASLSWVACGAGNRSGDAARERRQAPTAQGPTAKAPAHLASEPTAAKPVARTPSGLTVTARRTEQGRELSLQHRGRHTVRLRRLATAGHSNRRIPLWGPCPPQAPGPACRSLAPGAELVLSVATGADKPAGHDKNLCEPLPRDLTQLQIATCDDGGAPVETATLRVPPLTGQP